MKPLHAKLVLGGAMLGLLVAATGFERCPQVVGFAQTGSEYLAPGQLLAAQVTGPAVNMGHVSGMPGNGRSLRAIGVVYKLNDSRKIPPIAHLPHQALAMASVQVPQQEIAARKADDLVQRQVHGTAASSPRMVQTLARVSSARNSSRTVSDSEPSQPAGVVTQWVVVTAWQNGQATRMVFATARAADGAGQAAADLGAASEESTSAESGPSFAAVPVRGGWLVFRL
jgi:hypothetical protein